MENARCLPEGSFPAILKGIWILNTPCPGQGPLAPAELTQRLALPGSSLPALLEATDVVHVVGRCRDMPV